MYGNIREEELKLKVGNDWFEKYDYAKKIGNIDCCVSPKENELNLFESESLLWAEAKKGKSNIYTSLVQLIITIGKARSFDSYLPPPFLGAFDCEKIAFIPYNEIQEIFYQNDFNWNVTPSDYDTDKNDLKCFIKNNFLEGKTNITKIQIDKNNFLSIYTKWLNSVKPTIVCDWDSAKEKGLIDGDFYLADLLSEENKTIKEKLFVLLKSDHYEIDRKLGDMGMFQSTSAIFNDNQIGRAS